MVFRLAHFTDKEHERRHTTLQLAVDKPDYGKRKLPKGQTWGVVAHALLESVVVYVMGVPVDQDKPRVYRATVGVHANCVVSPTGAEA